MLKKPVSMGGACRPPLQALKLSGPSGGNGLELETHAQATGHACAGSPRFAAKVKFGKAPRLVGNPEACLQDARIARAEAPGRREGGRGVLVKGRPGADGSLEARAASLP